MILNEGLYDTNVIELLGERNVKLEDFFNLCKYAGLYTIDDLQRFNNEENEEGRMLYEALSIYLQDKGMSGYEGPKNDPQMKGESLNSEIDVADVDDAFDESFNLDDLQKRLMIETLTQPVNPTTSPIGSQSKMLDISHLQGMPAPTPGNSNEIVAGPPLSSYDDEM